MEAAGGCAPSELKVAFCHTVITCKMLLFKLELPGPSGTGLPCEARGHTAVRTDGKGTSTEQVSPTSNPDWKRGIRTTCIRRLLARFQRPLPYEERSYSGGDVMLFSLWREGGGTQCEAKASTL